MSDQGDAQSWRPVSNESGIEPDDPTGPMPAVTDEEPGFPPVGEEQAAWSAETTGGFPATSERAPFEPADPVPAEEQSFSALRASLAERLARYAEPEDGWPDPPPPSFGNLNAASEETPPAHEDPPPYGFADHEPATGEGPPYADESPYGAADKTAQGLPFVHESSYGAADETAQGLSFVDRSFNGAADETAQGLPFVDESSNGAAEKTAQGLPFVDESSYRAAEETAQGSSFVDGSSYGAADETAQGPSFVDRSSYGAAEETAQGLPFVDGSSNGAAEKTAQGLPYADESAYGAAEEVPQGPPPFADGSSYGGRDSTRTLPYAEESSYGAAAEQDAENEFFGSEDQVWDKVAAPSGPPPQPGRPSSGNMRMPDWMKDGGTEPTGDHEEPRRSRVALYSGIGVLVLGLLVAGGVALMKKGDGGTPPPVDRAASPTAPATGRPRVPREKALARFRGQHTKPLGRIADRLAGLSYPRLSRPWAMASKKSPLSEIGFSMSQFAVTERTGGRPTRWGRLMSGQLPGTERSAYHGPGTERATALQVADLLEARMYAFRHRKRALASQPLNVGGHKGWLVGYYLTYHRPGVRATAEIFTVAVVDTGRGTPGVLCMTVPNTDRKLWPDVNFVTRALRVI